MSGNDPDGLSPEGAPDPFRQIFEALGSGSLPPELMGMLSAAGLPSDPAVLQAAMAQMSQLMASGDDGPVNWDLARQVARQVAAEGGDPSVGDAADRQIAEALRTADLWLDRVTDLPAATARTHAWSRAEWVESTLDTWHSVVEPIATNVGRAIGEAMSAQAAQLPGADLSMMQPMLRRMGGTVFGAQVGQAVGGLAREVLGGGDVALPLLPARETALLPANVAAFGEGLGLPIDEVRLYLALREAAFARLVAAVPWLRAHLMASVEEYARGIAVDTDGLQEAVRSIEPSNLEALQEALSGGLFDPGQTPAQQAALDRLETGLALVEGWVDEVVDAAAAGSLPHAAALREAVRRRRAAGGPAEHTFATLVGLELRPRRLREAAALWNAVEQARGTSARDELWQHPDLLPTSQALEDPRGFAERSAGPEALDLDAELTRLLEDEQGDGGRGPAQ